MKTFFGTDGIRGKAGKGILSSPKIYELGRAIAQWSSTQNDNPAFIIAHDTRSSSDYIKSALKSELLFHGIDVYDMGVSPTPSLFYEIKHKKYPYTHGIMITASHNPYQDNGLKIINEQGKISRHDQEAIYELYLNKDNTRSADQYGHEHHLKSSETTYADTLKKICSPHFLRGKKVVLDSGHGATSFIAESIFAHYGADVISLHCNPNGYNINYNCGSTSPEYIQQYVINHHADIGCAFDGDGDRVILIDRDGSVKDGDDILCLLSQHPLYNHQQTYISTIMSNQGLDDYITSQNKKLVKSPVGDSNVCAYIDTYNACIGAEQSGHIIIKDVIKTGDGIASALKTCESLFYNNNWEMRTFEKYPQKVLSLPITEKKPLDKEPIKNILNHAQSLLSRGRIYPRYSGTESVMRILIEDRNIDNIDRISTYLIESLRFILST
jgi:phosphoglucosamine mutase